MANRDLSKKFASFANRPVDAVEEKETLVLGDDKYVLVNVTVDEKSPALVELAQAVKEAQLRLRLIVPGTLHTQDYLPNRLNVDIIKGEDGQYYIGSKFNLG